MVLQCIVTYKSDTTNELKNKAVLSLLHVLQCGL